MQKKDICKAFCNAERLKILMCLQKSKTVSELLKSCDLGQSALSQHLKVLKDSDLLKSNKVGKNVLYKTRDKKVLDIAKSLLNFK